MSLVLVRRLVVIALLVAGAAARASDVDAAKAHFTVGQAEFEKGRYAAAAHEFLEAYRLSRRLDLLYNIALCYRRLDDPGRATDYYRRYLTAFPDAPDRAQIEAELQHLKPRVGLVRVRALNDSKIVVDGELVGTAPLDPIYLSAGRHRIEAQPPTGAPVVVQVRVAGAGQVDVDALPPLVFSSSAASPSPSRPRWLWPVVGAVATVVVVGVVTGVALGTAGTDYRAQARSSCTSPSCALVDLSRGAAP